MITLRRSMLAAATATLVLLTVAASAWACVAGPTLLATPEAVAAGSEVQLSGISYDETLPVTVRFNGLDGPVLGEFPVLDDSTSGISGAVTIPEGTSPGNYVLVATQPTPDGSLGNIPTRALVRVIGDGGAPVLGAPIGDVPLERPTELAQTAPVTTGSLVLAGVGVAGVALFLAGAVVLVSGRRQPSAEAARVK